MPPHNHGAASIGRDLARGGRRVRQNYQTKPFWLLLSASSRPWARAAAVAGLLCFGAVPLGRHQRERTVAARTPPAIRSPSTRTSSRSTRRRSAAIYGVARQEKGRYLTLDQLDVGETQGIQVCARHVEHRASCPRRRPARPARRRPPRQIRCPSRRRPPS